MAEGFLWRHLSVQAYCQGFTRWHYRAARLSLDHVLTSGFFDPASDAMQPGDMVDVSAADGGATVFIEEAGKEGLPVRFRKMAVVAGPVL